MSIAERPFFSIILPTYNVEKYIQRCIDSCLAQSFKFFEILVVDDFGNDSSIEIANKYKNIDSRIFIVSYGKNVGTYHARRKGVEKAKGLYTLFLDPDDEISTDALQKLYDKLTTESVDLVFFGVEQRPVFNTRIEKREIVINSHNKYAILNYIFMGGAKLNFGTPGQLFRTEVVARAILSLDIPPETRLLYAEDALLLFSVVVNSTSCLSLNDKLYIYYKNPNAATTSLDFKSLENSVKQIDAVLFYLASYASSLNDSSVSEAAIRLSKKLTYDRSFLARYLPKYLGFGGYLHNLLIMLKIRQGFSDFIKLLIYIFSFGLKKL